MIYLSHLNKYTGSINASLLFLQSMYWYGKMNKPFYKFLMPCQHLLYSAEKHDSWQEEMGFTESQLKSALKKIGTKLKRGHEYNLLECGLLLYWSAGNGITYYIPNYPKLLCQNIEIALLEKHFPHFQKWKTSFSEVENHSWEIRFSPSPKFNFDFSYTKTTQEIKTDNTQRGQPSSNFYENSNYSRIEEKEKISAKKEKEELVMPFKSESFEQTWQAWKQHRKTKSNFIYRYENEQAALFQLQDYEEAFAINLIQTAIASDWNNFHFAETPQKFQKYLNTKNYECSNNRTEKSKFAAGFAGY